MTDSCLLMAGGTIASPRPAAKSGRQEPALPQRQYKGAGGAAELRPAAPMPAPSPDSLDHGEARDLPEGDEGGDGPGPGEAPEGEGDGVRKGSVAVNEEGIDAEPWAVALHLGDLLLPSLRSIPGEQITAVKEAAGRSLLVDPKDSLTRARCPVLAFFGEPDRNLAGWRTRTSSGSTSTRRVVLMLLASCFRGPTIPWAAWDGLLGGALLLARGAVPPVRERGARHPSWPIGRRSATIAAMRIRSKLSFLAGSILLNAVLVSGLSVWAANVTTRLPGRRLRLGQRHPQHRVDAARSDEGLDVRPFHPADLSTP